MFQGLWNFVGRAVLVALALYGLSWAWEVHGLPWLERQAGVSAPVNHGVPDARGRIRI